MVKGPELGEEARQDRPSNGSELGVSPDSLIQILRQTGRETTSDPEPGLALREPAAGTSPPDWGCWVRPVSISPGLLFLEEEK